MASKKTPSAPKPSVKSTPKAPDPSPAKSGKGAGKAYPGVHQQTHVT